MRKSRAKNYGAFYDSSYKNLGHTESMKGCKTPLWAIKRRLGTLGDRWNSLTSQNAAVEPGSGFVVKDNIATLEEPTTAASRMLEAYKSPYAATVVSLLTEKGFQVAGKANMDEFGMGSANVHLLFGPTTNPAWERGSPEEGGINSKYSDVLFGLKDRQLADLDTKIPSSEKASFDAENTSYEPKKNATNAINTDAYPPRVSGGSSGGSAAAVAAGIAKFALGTDTGGSVRLPASYTRTIGFKPSYGRVLRWGVFPYAQTFDTVGVIAREMAEIRSVFGVIDKYDPKDPTSLPNTVRDDISVGRAHIYGAEAPKARKWTFGVPKELLVAELSEDTVSQWAQLLSKIVEQGHTVVPVSVPSIRRLLSAYYTLVTAEAASNLSRYDGVRYGYRGQGPYSNTSTFITGNRDAAFGPEVQRRIVLGNYTLSADSGDHYFTANGVRRTLVEELNGLFRLPNFLMGAHEAQEGAIDLLVLPTSVGDPATIEEYMRQEEANFLSSYTNDILTVPASLAGIPAVSVPCMGFQGGVQIMGQYGDDESVLDAAEILRDI